MYTDRSAIKEVLGSPNPSGKHAQWWTKVYGSGVRELKICHRAGHENVNADALSRSPHAPSPQVDMMEGEVQVVVVNDS